MKKIIYSILFLLVFSGCESVPFSTEAPPEEVVVVEEEKTTKTGFFIDSPVMGVSYSTTDFAGKTKETGGFTYYEGEDCTFKLGNINLGTVQCVRNTTIYHIAGVIDINKPTQKVKNIARLLQSLNINTLTQTYIQIPEELDNLSLPSNFTLDQKDDTKLEEILLNAENLINDGTTFALIDEQTAIDNMNSYISSQNIDITENVEFNKPEITSNSEIIILENTQEVMTITFTDLDEADTHTFSIYGEDAQYLQIDEQTGYLEFKPDNIPLKSVKSVYNIEVMVDDGKLSDVLSLQINISDNQQPIISNVSNYTVEEGDSEITNILASDSDLNDDGQLQELSYSLSGADAQYFNINALTGALSFAAGMEPDYDEKNTYDVTVIVTDDGDYSLSTELDLQIQVNYPPIPDFWEIKKLKPEVEDFIDYGNSVSRSGNYIVIGATDYVNQNGVKTGKVYVYEIDEVTDNIELVGEILPTEEEENLGFGQSVAINNGVLAVSVRKSDYTNNAITENNVTQDVGSVRMYSITGANHTVTYLYDIYNPLNVTTSSFANKLKWDGNYLFITAPTATDTVSQQGLVYVYNINLSTLTYPETEPYILKSEEISTDEKFGSNIAIDNGYLLVSAEYKTINAQTNAGRVYFYSFNLEEQSFTNISILQEALPLQDSYYGTSIDISNGYFLVGSLKSLEEGIIKNKGKITVYKINETVGSDEVTVEKKSFFQPSDLKEGDNFGKYLQFDEKNIIASSTGFDFETGVDDGTVYYFRLNKTTHQAEEKQHLYPYTLQDGEKFGRELLLDEHYFIVSTEGDNHVYVYELEPIEGKIYLYDFDDTIGVYQSSNNVPFHQFNEFVEKDNNQLTYTISGQDASYFQIINNNFIEFVVPPTTLNNSSQGTNEYIIDLTVQNIQEGVLLDEMVKEVKITLIPQVYQEIEEIHPSNNNLGQDFGNQVKISNDYILASSPYDDEYEQNSGGVYLYKKNNTTNEVILKHYIKPSDYSQDMNFGYSIALDENYIVIGAPNDDQSSLNSGAAYVYRINQDETITQIAKLKSTQIQEEEKFGSYVEIKDGNILVGATGTNYSYEDPDLGPMTTQNTGSVYVFRLNTVNSTISSELVISNPEPNQNDKFGSVISMSKNEIFLHTGSVNDTTGEITLDNAEVINTTWIDSNYLQDDSSNQYYLTMDDGLGNETLYTRNYIEQPEDVIKHYNVYKKPSTNPYILISMAKREGDLTNKVFLYQLQSGGLDYNIAYIDQIVDTSGETESQFGFSHSVNGEYFVISNYKKQYLDIESHGIVYLYKIDTSNNTYSLVQTLKDEPKEYAEYFGYSLALKDNILAVGVPHSNTSLTEFEHKETGSVVLYELDILTDTLTQIQEAQSNMQNDGLSKEYDTKNHYGEAVDVNKHYLIVGDKNYYQTGLGIEGSIFINKRIINE